MSDLEEPDFLDEMIAESTARNPEFPRIMDEARQRRELLRHLAAIRVRDGISQTAVAARMETSQPTVARLESYAYDVKLSTLQRYAAALGKKIEWQIIDA